MFKPIRFIPDDTKIQFMRLSRFGFFAVRPSLRSLSILLFVFVGLNYGVDFKGGTVFIIRTEQAANLDELRTKINGLGLRRCRIAGIRRADTTSRSGCDARRRRGGAAGASSDKVKQALGPGVEYLQRRSRRPQGLGRTDAAGHHRRASSPSSASLIYIWFRFEWQFAIGAVVSLLHDVILTIGLFCLIGIEFNLSIIAAILTIVGYSLNDTVVVFDRIREYHAQIQADAARRPDRLLDQLRAAAHPADLGDDAAGLIALYIFGGEVLRGFTFAMIWGVLIGTYSSIFIASPVLILLGTKRELLGERRKAKAAAGRRP